MTKKLLSIILALCLTLMLAIPATAEGGIYLAIGDSITTGYGLAEGEKGFADIIAEQNGYTLINKAVDGSTTADLLALLADPTMLPTVMQADVITITCGGNDLMGLLYTAVCDTYNASMPLAALQISLEDVPAIMNNPEDQRQTLLLACAQIVLTGNEENGILPFAQSEQVQTALIGYLGALNTIVAGIKQFNPDVTIIVTTQYNPYKTFTGPYATLSAGLEAGVQALSLAITLNSQMAGYLVADVYTAFAANEANLCNATMLPLELDFHPNAAGHAVIAECVQQVLDAAK